MKQVPIHQADEVVNVRNGAESWSVQSVDSSENAEDKLVVLKNNNQEIGIRWKTLGTESQLERDGYR